jgi:type I restriction enzyme M protein
MLAPHIKKKVDKLWDRFWSAGITNPLVAVEQITYLLFLKRLESIDVKRQQRGSPSIYLDNERCKWSYIRQQKNDVKHLIEVVFPWLRQLETQLSNQSKEDVELIDVGSRMADAYFQLDPNKGQVLSDAIDLIDQLFARANGSAAQDIMGDTFEYLLSEIATAGKNGQFRTPRHLIRLMVELIDPQPGHRIIDPAAGTGGFLFSAQQYLLRKFTPEGNLRIEWDGSPHRIDGSGATKEQDAAIHNGALFVGLDNDRTMSRIGWMNLILHGLENPHIFQADSLSKREGKQNLAKLAAPESYDIVFANPPFKGTVDAGDIDGDSVRFPRGKKKDSKGIKLALTDKSELLFCWLMLDLLDIGGRCAVIVPEGVLFQSTDAHVRLRRELLTEHAVEGVISLPGGVFQPYSGVKTSILIFRKQTKRDAKVEFKGQVPLTQHVWFYEISEDGYSLDSKRRELPMGNNDLWDALEKFHAWSNRSPIEGTSYYQPAKTRERWRMVQVRDGEDTLTPLGEGFADDPEVKAWEGRVAAIHELFPELPADPAAATELISETSAKALKELFLRLLAEPTKPIWDQLTPPIDINEAPYLAKWSKAIKKTIESFNRTCREAWKYFEQEDSPALSMWKESVAKSSSEGLDFYGELLREAPSSTFPALEPVNDISESVSSIAREFAKLDGFDVTLRSLELTPVANALKAPKHWIVPVREFARNEEWRSSNDEIVGSHDARGQLRPEYLQFIEREGIYEEDGTLKQNLLDPECIEARDWNLSAGQYKPFDFTRLRSDKSITQLIDAVMDHEVQIMNGLNKLKTMVEGAE